MKIDGIDIKQNYNISLIYDGEETLTPEVRAFLQEKTGHGSVYFGATHGNRVFKIPLIAEGDNRNYNVREFMRLFLDEDGEFKKVLLELDFLPNRRIKVFTNEGVKLKPLGQNSGSFELTLIADYPFFESIYNTNYYVDPITVPHEVAINYYGTKATGFKISISGTIGNFTITREQSDGSTKQFIYESASHSTYMVIDFEDFAIDDNGANGLPNSKGDFLEINYNTAKLIFDGDISGALSIDVREKYAI